MTMQDTAYSLAIDSVTRFRNTAGEERDAHLRLAQVYATLAIVDAIRTFQADLDDGTSSTVSALDNIALSLESIHAALRDQTAAIDEIETRLATWSQQ